MPATRPAVQHAERTYRGAKDQIRVVRADLRGLLDGCPITDDLILCASELATNAVLHNRSSGPSAYFTVRAEIHHGDYAWIEVEDDGRPWTEPSPCVERIRGLDIIRALASDWGIDGGYRSRVVWVRIDWPAAPDGSKGDGPAHRLGAGSGREYPNAAPEAERPAR